MWRHTIFGFKIHRKVSTRNRYLILLETVSSFYKEQHSYCIWWSLLSYFRFSNIKTAHCIFQRYPDWRRSEFDIIQPFLLLCALFSNFYHQKTLKSVNMFVKSSVKLSPLRRRLGGVLAHVRQDLALSSKTSVHGVFRCVSITAGFHTGNKMDQRTVSLDNMNPNIKVMEYAVRGPLVIRAAEIEKELREVR